MQTDNKPAGRSSPRTSAMYSLNRGDRRRVVLKGMGWVGSMWAGHSGKSISRHKGSAVYAVTLTKKQRTMVEALREQNTGAAQGIPITIKS